MDTRTAKKRKDLERKKGENEEGYVHLERRRRRKSFFELFSLIKKRWMDCNLAFCLDKPGVDILDDS